MEPTNKDVVINREALLNRLCALYSGKKEYSEILVIAKGICDENFHFCYPLAEKNQPIHAGGAVPKKRGASVYDKDIRTPF